MKKLIQLSLVAIAFSAVTSCVAVVGNTAQPVVNVEPVSYTHLDVYKRQAL